MELCKSRGISGAKLCREVGMQPSILTDIKMGRQRGLSAKNAQKVATFFGVSVGYLLGEENKPLVNDDEELTELLERVRDDPHLRMLFSITKDATPEDVEKAIKIIQTLKGE